MDLLRIASSLLPLDTLLSHQVHSRKYQIRFLPSLIWVAMLAANDIKRNNVLTTILMSKFHEKRKKKSIFRVIMWQLFFNSLLKPSAKLQSFHFFFLILICNFNSDKDSNIMSKSKICHYIHLSVPAFCQEDHGLWSKRDSQSKWR